MFNQIMLIYSPCLACCQKLACSAGHSFEILQLCQLLIKCLFTIYFLIHEEVEAVQTVDNKISCQSDRYIR